MRRWQDFRLQGLLFLGGVLLCTAACTGETKRVDDTAAIGTTDTAGGTTSTNSSDSMASPQTGAPPEGATVQMVALGDSIFHGQVASGTCFTCHGVNAQGTALAPPLTKHQWLTGDGSYGFIQERVTNGMPTPTPPYVAAMPPMGGASLTPDQVKAVSAYVYSISR